MIRGKGFHHQDKFIYEESNLILKTAKSKEGRVVNVSSVGHSFTDNYIADDMDCSQGWNTTESYCRSKLANVMFTFSLADKFEKSKLNIKAASLHPGFIDTNFQNDHCFYNIFRYVFCCCSKSPERGAVASLHASRASWVDLKNGSYFNTDETLKEPSDASKNREECERLWKLSEKIYEIKFEI